MTVLRTLAAYEVVQRTFPRPPREGDEVAKAIGRAIDTALSQAGHDVRSGRRPTVAGLRTLAESLLDHEVAAAGERLAPDERAKVVEEIHGVLRAYRTSPIFGLPRPKSRLVVIGDEVGIYAQPDYWDGRARFYEMKSYLAIPPPPDVALQLRLFQLAFPGLESVLICFDRHVAPVVPRTQVVPPPTPAEAAMTLRRAYDLAREHGTPKVREYLEGPFVPYPTPPPSAAPAPP